MSHVAAALSAAVGRLGTAVREAPRLSLVILCAVLFLPGLGGRDLWNPDEPRYAEVTREMLADGQYLVPHLNGEIYSHKPPVAFWAMAASARLTGGLDETAVRLPSLLAAVGTVLLCFGIGRRLFGPPAGVLAAFALATTIRVLWQARTGQIDMLLAFFVAATAYLWTRGRLEQRPGLYLTGFAVAGVGTITKGPVALLPILLAFVAFLWLEGERAELGRMRIGRGLAIWLAVIVAWLVPAMIAAGPEYFRDIVLTQNLTRFTAGTSYVGTRGHLHPWYYFATTVPVDFLPWTVLLPAAGLAIRRYGDERQRSGSRFAICWALVTLLFFSIPPAKRSVYALQMLPALALILGAGLAVLGRRAEREESRWLSLPLIGLSLVFGIAAAGMAIAAPSRPELADLPGALPVGLIGAAAALSVFAVVAGVTVRRSVASAVTVLGLGFGATVAGLSWGVLPMLDAVKSVRPVAERFLELSRDGESYGFYPAEEPALQFYTGRVGVLLETEAELFDFLEREPRGWLFAEIDDLERLERSIDAVEVGRAGSSERGYVLLLESERPWSAGASPRRPEVGDHGVP